MAVERDDFMLLSSKIYFLEVQKRKTTTDDACRRMNDFHCGKKVMRGIHAEKVLKGWVIFSPKISVNQPVNHGRVATQYRVFVLLFPSS